MQNFLSIALMNLITSYLIKIYQLIYFIKCAGKIFVEVTLSISVAISIEELFQRHFLLKLIKEQVRLKYKVLKIIIINNC